MKIVTSAEMREIDRITSDRYGVTSLTLMENAGAAVAGFVLKHYPSARNIGVICGKGNNGGDGFVAARRLRDAGKAVKVLLLAEPSELRGDAAAMFSKLEIAPVLATSTGELAAEKAQAVFNCDVLIDAILGSGFRPRVSALYAHAIVHLNASGRNIVAVDIPSGADADLMGAQGGTVARADAIVTFTAPRPAHSFGSLSPGPILIAPIGSPDEAIVSTLRLNLITPNDHQWAIKPRPADSNKGNFGHVLVTGASVGMSGSAAMAGMAALRSGAGLVTIACPKSALPTVASFHPELMTRPLEETDAGSIAMRALDYGRLDELVKGKTVLAIGPGVSRNAETSEFVRTIVKKYDMPIVLDADGLNAFEGYTHELSGAERPLVITPHPGEMARLLGSSVREIQSDRLEAARKFAADHNLIVVLKGHRTLIAQPNGEVWVNPTGNPGMATGGTGDILTGIIASLIGQNPNRIVDAVVAATYIHGLAGDVACEIKGEQSLVATDLITFLPDAFRRIKELSGVSEVVI
ncbi:MAG: NAD(P)H-hydrate dehydratase [Acidobacteriales bacterium]|nr:NAD(P)H-hydrate dehydratase [Terriglobales bacterium]